MSGDGRDPVTMRTEGPDPAALRRLARAADRSRARRAVVLSGGGAKGVFESGVLHAFVQIDLDPHVVTGSSVGALNAVAYAEVLRARHAEGEDAAAAVLDRALELWLRLDRDGIADLDAWGWRVWALGIGAPLAGLLFLWIAIAGGPWGGLLGLVGRVVALLVGLCAMVTGYAVLRLWLTLPERLRTRVRRGLRGAEGAAPATAAARPLSWPERLGRWLGVAPSLFRSRGLRRAVEAVVPAGRRLSEFRESGVDVRLTRTNLRTGRTEVSEHLDAGAPPPVIERGRRVPGDPRAVPAALASCAFPVAYPPVPATDIYPAAENPQLYARLEARAAAKHELAQVFGPRSKGEYLWLMGVLDELAEGEPGLLRAGAGAALRERLERRFIGERALWARVSERAVATLVDTRAWPQLPLAGTDGYSDRYFDGGILDNTPLSTALAALRDAESTDAGDDAAGGEIIHEIFVVLLATRPRPRYLPAAAAARLEGPALGVRALRLQAEQRLIDDVKTAEKFDRLLARARPVAPAPVAAAPAPEPRSAPAGAAGSWSEVFARERAGIGLLPLLPAAGDAERFVRAAVTRIQPSWDLPWVLALSRRLGFDTAMAREFQARGCRDALLALHARYAAPALAGAVLPPHARGVRRLLGGGWEEEPRPGWSCQAERCALREACRRVVGREAAAASPRTAMTAAAE